MTLNFETFQNPVHIRHSRVTNTMTLPSTFHAFTHVEQQCAVKVNYLMMQTDTAHDDSSVSAFQLG